MTLDALVANDARRALDPGMPAPLVFTCRHGHTERLGFGVDVAPPATYRAPQRCAVCGVEIPRQKGAAARKSCGPEHKRFIARKRAEAELAHRRLHRAHSSDTPFVPFRFIIEAQPWYRGAATAFQPPAAQAVFVVPTGPDFPEIPAAWLEGFRRLYPALEEPGPLLPSTFPAIGDLDTVGPLSIPSRRYRRRKPTVAPTAEQRI